MQPPYPPGSGTPPQGPGSQQFGPASQQFGPASQQFGPASSPYGQQQQHPQQHLQQQPMQPMQMPPMQMPMQPPPASAQQPAQPAQQQQQQPAPKKEKEKADGEPGIASKILDFARDRSVELLMMFIGLYAAIAVQKCQDDQKDRESYKKLLGDFKTEITDNQKQREAIEKELGVITEHERNKSLGPLTKRFDEFTSRAALLERMFSCYTVMIDGAIAKPTATQAELVSPECAKTFDAVKKSGKDDKDEEALDPIFLEPIYRTEVQQLYLAEGIKIFDNKELAVKIGEVYALQKEVVKGVNEVEVMFNDSFMGRKADLQASGGELAEIDKQTKSIADAGPLRAKLGSLAREVRVHRFAIVKLKNLLDQKVGRLKERMIKLDEKSTAVLADIDKEMGSKK